MARSLAAIMLALILSAAAAKADVYSEFQIPNGQPNGAPVQLFTTLGVDVTTGAVAYARTSIGISPALQTIAVSGPAGNPLGSQWNLWMFNTVSSVIAEVFGSDRDNPFNPEAALLDFPANQSHAPTPSGDPASSFTTASSSITDGSADFESDDVDLTAVFGLADVATEWDTDAVVVPEPSSAALVTLAVGLLFCVAGLTRPARRRSVAPPSRLG